MNTLYEAWLTPTHYVGPVRPSDAPECRLMEFYAIYNETKQVFTRKILVPNRMVLLELLNRWNAIGGFWLYYTR